MTYLSYFWVNGAFSGLRTIRRCVAASVALGWPIKVLFVIICLACMCFLTAGLPKRRAGSAGPRRGNVIPGAPQPPRIESLEDIEDLRRRQNEQVCVHVPLCCARTFFT